MEDPYALLGVKRDAAEEEIRSAFRQLARRWHPDRFPEGPERMWAEDKMARINEAYKLIVSGKAGRICYAEPAEEKDAKLLEEARRLLENGSAFEARHVLMRVATRGPEWNYLFGSVLLKLEDLEKACLYFGVAVNQRPEDARYRDAYRNARAARDLKHGNSLVRRLLGGTHKG